MRMKECDFLHGAIVAVIALLNGAIIGFYILWSIADSRAVDAAEASGFNQAVLLPHAHLMWITAQASLVLVFVLDVCVGIAWRRRRRRRRNGLRRGGVLIPSREAASRTDPRNR